MLFARLSGLVAVLAPVVSLACGGTSSPAAVPQEPSPAASSAEAPAGAADVPNPGTVSGTVAEAMASGGYTYVRLTDNGRDTWMAAPEVLSVKVGDQLVGTVSLPMAPFRSRTLNREFDVIYFVSRVTRNGEVLEPVAAPPGDMTMAGAHGEDVSPVPTAPVEPVAPAPGGLRVADVWAGRDGLAGKTVTVRARVVKANYEIMGVNWYHLQDGSGVVAAGTHDVVVTSAAELAAGDIVTVSGTLATDKDFGAGYAYAAIVEGADIRK